MLLAVEAFLRFSSSTITQAAQNHSQHFGKLFVSFMRTCWSVFPKCIAISKAEFLGLLFKQYFSAQTLLWWLIVSIQGLRSKNAMQLAFTLGFSPNGKDHIPRNPWEGLSVGVNCLSRSSLPSWWNIREAIKIFSNFFRLSMGWNPFVNFKVSLEKWVMNAFWRHTLPIPFRHIPFCLVSFCSPPKKSTVAKIIEITCQ